MRKTLRTTAALLALPVLINAVALSDMTPRAQNLPPACNHLYTAQIDGCTSQDWQSQQCSPSCSHAMQALVAPIAKFCGGQGIQGQNLIVAFLAGVGPQQLCHNLSPQTTGQTTAASPTPKTSPSPKPTTESSSTSTANSATKTGSLMVDSSSSASETSTRRTTAKQTKTTPEASSSAVVSSSEAAATTTGTNTATTSSTQTTSAEGNSQTNFDDGSGGGSPFDTAGNLMNAASGLSVSLASFMMPAVAAALFAVLR